MPFPFSPPSSREVGSPVSSLLPAFWVVLELSRRWFRVRVWSSNRVLAGSGRVLARTRACRRGRARPPGLLWSPVLRPSWGRLTAGKASWRRGGAPGAYCRRGRALSRPVGDGQGGGRRRRRSSLGALEDSGDLGAQECGDLGRQAAGLGAVRRRAAGRWGLLPCRAQGRSKAGEG